MCALAFQGGYAYNSLVMSVVLRSCWHVDGGAADDQVITCKAGLTYWVKEGYFGSWWRTYV